MYLIPKVFKCPKCKETTEYAPNHPYFLANPAHVFEILCQQCFYDFMSKNVPLMQEIKDEKP